MPRTRTTLILLLLASLLAAFIWFYERKTDSHAVQREKASLLFQFNPAEVRQLSVQTSSGKVTVRKEPSGWTVVEPVQARADTGEILGMLDFLASLQVDRRISGSDVSKEALSNDYRLAPPAVTVSFGGDTFRHDLKLGATSPFGSGVYAQISDSPDIFLLDGAALKILARDLPALRDRTLFSFSPAEVSRVELNGGDPQIPRRIEILFTNDTARITRPIHVPADTARTRELVASLPEFTVMDFVSDGSTALRDFGLDEPRFEISVFLAGQTNSQSLLFGLPTPNDPGKVYARLKGSSAVVTVNSMLLDAFNRPVNDFRDRHLARLNPEDVFTIGIRQKNRSLEMSRSNDLWLITGSRPADPVAVAELLKGLSEAKVTEFVSDAPGDLKPLGLDPAQTVVTLQRVPSGPAADEGSTNAAPLVILLGRKDDKKGVYAKLRDEPFVYRVDSSIEASLTPDPVPFWDRRLFPETLANVDALQFQHADRSYSLVRDPASGKWKLGEDSVGVVDARLLEAFLKVLPELRASSIVTANPANLKTYGLDKPVARLLLTAGSSSEELLVGKPANGGGRYAKVRSSPLITVINPDLYELLTARLVREPAPSAP